jgi:hypothetical protein
MHRKRILVAAVLAAAALFGVGSAVLMSSADMSTGQDTVVLAGYDHGWSTNRGW